jgi:hypothetical protein
MTISIPLVIPQHPKRPRTPQSPPSTRPASGSPSSGRPGAEQPPAAYALASDTLIGVVRAAAIARHQHLVTALTADTLTPLAIGCWRSARSPPGRRARPAPPGRGRGVVPRKVTKTARFLDLVTERHGPLASIPLESTAQIASGPGSPRRAASRHRPHRASDYLRGYFHAAALAGYDLRAVTAWVSGADPHVPERILAAAGALRARTRVARGLFDRLWKSRAWCRYPVPGAGTRRPSLSLWH